MACAIGIPTAINFACNGDGCRCSAFSRLKELTHKVSWFIISARKLKMTNTLSLFTIVRRYTPTDPTFVVSSCETSNLNKLISSLLLRQSS